MGEGGVEIKSEIINPNGATTSSTYVSFARLSYVDVATIIILHRLVGELRARQPTN